MHNSLLDDLILIAEAGNQEEFAGQLVYIPFRAIEA
jgi:hypothetical protein